AGLEEAVAIERVGARHAVVALHEGRALDEDLARLARRRRPARFGIDDADLHAGERAAEGFAPYRRRIVVARARDAGRRLAHAVHADGDVIRPHEPIGERVVRALGELDAPRFP